MGVAVSACAFVASFGRPRHYYFIIFGFLFQEPLVAEMVFCSRVLSFLFFFLYDICIRLCGFFIHAVIWSSQHRPFLVLLVRVLSSR